jgi:hypothetical protein
MPHPRTMPRREVEMECVLFVFIYDAFKFALSWPQGTSGCMQSLTRTPKTDRSRGHSCHIERGDIKTHPRILPTTFNTVAVACSFVCHPAGICCCRCLFSSTHPKPRVPILSRLIGRRLGNAYPLPPPLPFFASSAPLRALRVRLRQNRHRYRGIPTPKLFFTNSLSKIACQAPKPTKKPITPTTSTR